MTHYEIFFKKVHLNITKYIFTKKRKLVQNYFLSIEKNASTSITTIAWRKINYERDENSGERTSFNVFNETIQNNMDEISRSTRYTFDRFSLEEALKLCHFILLIDPLSSEFCYMK